LSDLNGQQQILIFFCFVFLLQQILIAFLDETDLLMDEKFISSVKQLNKANL
jgi:hypothetical protein